MDTESFMTDIRSVTPSNNNSSSQTSAGILQANAAGQHVAGTPTPIAIGTTTTTVPACADPTPAATTVSGLSSQPSLVTQKIRSIGRLSSDPPLEDLPQLPDSSGLSVAKVILPTQVVVAHPFTEQQVQQQSVLFQALTSHGTPHFIAVAVPGQDGDRIEVQSAQPVSCVQYLDEGGGSNAFSTTNGHMTTYSVYPSADQPNMYTPNSTAYYNTTNNTDSFTQVVDASPTSVTAGLENHSFAADQQDTFQSVDENSATDHENSQPACFPSSKLSAATINWLNKNYELADGMSVPRSTMYTHYLKHCSDCKMEPLNAASFGKLIRSVFSGLRTRRLGTRGNSKYHYYGIRLKASSSINKTTDNMISATFRQNPFASMRRVRQDQSVKIENSDNSDDPKSCEINETGKRRRATSPNEQHHLYLGDASTAIPSVDIEINSAPYPDGITLDDIRRFRNAYRKHCESVLSAVVNFQFGLVETMWRDFWKRPNHCENGDEMGFSKAILLQLCEWAPIQEFVKHTDYQFYQNLVDVLIPEVLRPIPSTLTQAIRNFAKSLETWLKTAMTDCCCDLVNIKVSAISAFAQTLRRYTSLNHLAQAARAVLQSTTQIKQMTADLSKVDFRNIQEQASWVCQCEDETVQRLLCEFRQTLQHHLWLEDWAQWLENIVEATLKPYEDKPSYSKAARQFLLKWSFYSSLVIRDLTLRSAASFGSFHLLRLLYDEYMFYIIEHAIAKATGTTSVAVMGEYLCTGQPEQLCGKEDLNERLLRELSTGSNDATHLQNGFVSVKSSLMEE